MLYTLPPATDHKTPTGTLTIRISPTYIDTSISSLAYYIRFWGYSEPIQIDSQSLTRTFNVTTNLQKLTKYINDMGILSIEIRDSRLNKVIGIGFVKLRRYIVNDLLSEFEQDVEILGAANTANKQKKIGNLHVELSRKISQFIEEPEREEPKADYVKEWIGEKPQIKMPKHKDEKKRVLLVERHVFDAEDEKQQFQINQQRKNDKNELKKIGVNKKSSKNQEVQKQLSLEQLHMKYGKNNPCVQRMKLRMDEAKLFPKVPFSHHEVSTPFQLFVTDFKVLVNKMEFPDFSITLADTQNRPLIMKTINFSNYQKECMYLNSVAQHHKIIITTQDHIGECSCRGLLATGMTKLFLKRKDNQKRQIETSISLKQASVQKNDGKGKEQVMKPEKQKTEKKEYYYLVQIQNIDMLNPSFCIQINGFEPVTGDKIIYQSPISPQKVKIQVADQQYIGDIRLIIDTPFKQQLKTIFMKNQNEEKISKVKVRLGRTNTLNQIMNFVGKPVEKSVGSEKKEKINENKKQKHDRNSLLKIIIQSFECLSQCEDSECFEIIAKLNEEYTSGNFKKLVEKTEMPELTFEAFSALFHEEFSMYWKCFDEYRHWNTLYRKALNNLIVGLHRKRSIPSERILFKLRNHSDVLFGMLGISVVEKQLQKYFPEENMSQITQMLILMSRFSENMIKLEELNSVFDHPHLFSLRYFQLNEIFASQDEAEVQLLKEVFASCVEIKSSGLPLLQVLLKQEQVELENSVFLTEERQVTENHIQTDPNYYKTQQNSEQKQEKQQKQEINKSQKSQKTERESGEKIVLCIRKIELPTFDFHPNFTVTRFASQQNKIQIQPQNLPFAFTVQKNKQYRVEAKVGGDELIEGIFLASTQLHKIILYVKGERIGALQLAESEENNEKDIIRLQIHNKSDPFQEDIMNLHRQERQKQQEAEIINEKYGNDGNKYDKLQITIRSIKPFKQQQIISIEGAEKILQYPSQSTILIHNKNKAESFLKVSVDGIGTDQIVKEIGLQQVCINRSDGKIGCIMQVEVEEYLGEEQLEIGQKVLYLNMYYLQSLKPMKKGNYMIRVHTHSQSQPVAQKSIKISSQERNTKIHQTVSLFPSDSPYDIEVYESGQIVAHFSFKIRYSNELGIFLHKGYLVDERGHRLGIGVYEINYNDIFWTDPVGQIKFQSLLVVFRMEYLLQINPESVIIPQDDIKSIVRRTLGFTTTQIETLFSLMSEVSEMFNWQIYPIKSRIQTGAYTLTNLYRQYELFDFEGDGYILQSKGDIVNRLVLRATPIIFSEVNVDHREGWVVDVKNKQSQGYVDYMLILWSLRKSVLVDDYFSEDAQQNNIKNDTFIDQIENTGKILQVFLINYKELKVNGSPATLLFKLNGQPFSQPIPRCYTHQFVNPPSVKAKMPLKLQIYNKSYGVQTLWQYKLVEKVTISGQKVRILDGEINLKVTQGQESRSGWQKKSELQNTRNRKERWNEEKESVSSKRIKNILNSRLNLNTLNFDD